MSSTSRKKKNLLMVKREERDRRDRGSLEVGQQLENMVVEKGQDRKQKRGDALKKEQGRGGLWYTIGLAREKFAEKVA